MYQMDSPLRKSKKVQQNLLITKLKEQNTENLKFTQIDINNDNDMEQRIHTWLDEIGLKYCEPKDKMTDYYQELKIQSIRKINQNQKCFFSLENVTLQGDNEENGQDENLGNVFTSPLMMKRQKSKFGKHSKNISCFQMSLLQYTQEGENQLKDSKINSIKIEMPEEVAKFQLRQSCKSYSTKIESCSTTCSESSPNNVIWSQMRNCIEQEGYGDELKSCLRKNKSKSIQLKQLDSGLMDI